MKLSPLLKELNKATLRCPCPKCGKYDGIVADENHDEKSDTYSYRVRCKVCGVHPAEWSSGMVEAVSDWHDFCAGA